MNMFFHVCSLMLATLIAALAVPINAQEPGSQEKAYLGVFMQLDDAANEVKVIKVIEGSPAEGLLLPGDFLLRFNGTKATGLKQISELTQAQRPGDKVKLLVRRDDQELELEATLNARPSEIPELSAGERIKHGVFDEVSFEAGDGLEITADSFANVEQPNAPVIVLCHQAGWSRGEYREIAPKLNELGFNCLAIDQRSGGSVNEVENLTNKRARETGAATGFADAEQDMLAAVKWARKQHPESKIILWGSSYSAALALRLAGEHPDLIDGVISFAPGEYFERAGKPKDWITMSAKQIDDPVFITSAQNEVPRWTDIFDAIPGDRKAKFVPETRGNHGSRALWEKFEDSGDYWMQVTSFLSQFK